MDATLLAHHVADERRHSAESPELVAVVAPAAAVGDGGRQVFPERVVFLSVQTAVTAASSSVHKSCTTTLLSQFELHRCVEVFKRFDCVATTDVKDRTPSTNLWSNFVLHNFA